MSRTQWTLAGILVLQLLLLALTAPWSRQASASQARPLLPALEATSPSKIEIRNPDDKTLTLERREEGWSLPQADGYPADASKVADVLEQLKKIEVRRPVVSSSRYHKTLEVTDDEFQRRLQIWDGDEAPQIDLLIGSSPNYGVHHVRLRGDDRVYEVRELRPYELRPEPGEWIDKALLDWPIEEVTGLKVSNAHGEFELRRREEGWSLTSKDQEYTDLDSSKVDSFLRAVCNLRVSAPGGRADRAEFGLAKPTVSVEISRVSETEAEAVTLRIGAEMEGGEGKRYVGRDGFDYAAVISKWDADKLLDQKAGTLRQEG